jgi:hypothetical protein
MRCLFVEERFSFSGAPVEQARCLLREVGRWARVSDPLALLPPLLEGLIGEPMTIPRRTLETKLHAAGLHDMHVGGGLGAPLCRANDNAAEAPTAAYFVVHDTSTPNYETKDFPGTINTADWPGNDLSRWMKGAESRAHVFVNRLGESLTAVDFSRPWRATKFELTFGSLLPKGLFLHVELVQPRRSAPNGPAGNDALAPDPAFTQAQYAALALAYYCASFRKGAWLIPAFHGVLDSDLPDGHDDPQGFSTADWSREIARLL